ncbi:MAG: hypothetical protein AAGB11_00720 [Pseudomonadota bacterium]
MALFAPRARTAVAALAALIAWSLPATAFEPTGNAIADAYLRGYVGPGTAVDSVSGVGEDGGDVTIESFTVSISETIQDTAQSILEITARDVVISKPTLDGDTLVAERVDTGAVTWAGMVPGLRIDFASSQTRDVRLIDGAWGAGADWEKNLRSYGRSTAFGMAVSHNGETYATADTVAVENFILEPALQQAMAVEGLRVDATKLAQAAGSPPPRIALEDHPMAVFIDGRWNPENGETEIGAFEITAPSLGGIKLSTRLLGLTREAVKIVFPPPGSPQSQPEEWGALGIAALTLSVRDDGVAQDLVAMGAESSGLAPDAFIALATNGVAGALMAYPDAEFRTQFVAALGALMRGGSTMTLNANPPEPLLFKEFDEIGPATIDELPQKLGLSVESTPN